MKKILSLLLTLSLILVFAACGSQEGVSSKADTSETTQTESSDIASASDNNADESSSDAQISESSATASTETDKPSVSDKNNATSSKPTISTNSPTQTGKPTTSSTPSKPSNTTKPVEKPSKEETPYFVSAEIVSIERKYTTIQIDGMNIFDRLFGKNTTVQNGDKITVRVNMSDGSGNGFKPNPIFDYGFKDYTVNGNLITVTADGSDTELLLMVIAKRKDGSIGSNLVLDLREYIYSEDMMSDSMYKRLLLRNYATETLGMQWKDGAGFGLNTRFVVWNYTENWWDVVLDGMDSWVEKGYKYFCLSVVNGDFDSSVE